MRKTLAVLFAAVSISAAAAPTPPSQNDVWPIGSYVNALGNDAAVYLRTRGAGAPAYCSYGQVRALANVLHASLDGLSRSICSADPRIGAAASSSKDIVAALESVAGLSSAQSSGDAEGRIAADVKALKASYAESPCAAAFSPDGVAAPLDGDAALLGHIPDFSSDQGVKSLTITADPRGPRLSAVAIGVSRGSSFFFGALKVVYADKSEFAIPFRRAIMDYPDSWYALSPSIGEGRAVTVNIPPGRVEAIYLIDPGNDVSRCRTPGRRPRGDGSQCRTAVDVYGLARGNGLAP